MLIADSSCCIRFENRRARSGGNEMLSTVMEFEFPCGLKAKVTAGIFASGRLTIPDVCPLHGKRCRK